jgi:hypothetical protein
MNARFIFVLAVTVLTGCQQRDSISSIPSSNTRTNRRDAVDEILWAEHKGRYQLISLAATQTPGERPMLLKFDTATGHTWEYESMKVPNTNFAEPITVSGWFPIADSFTKESRRKANWNPHSEERLPDPEHE